MVDGEIFGRINALSDEEEHLWQHAGDGHGLTAEEHERLARTGPRSWVPAPREVFVRIAPELVTGRELVGGRTMYGVDLTP